MKFEFENDTYYVKVTEENYQVVSKVTSHVEFETKELPTAMKVCEELHLGFEHLLKGKSNIVTPSLDIIT